MDYDYLVFIGRFQPFHNGHASVVRQALSRAGSVIVLVGSANAPRTIRNPWTFGERAVMISSAMGVDAERLVIQPLRDHLYNEAHWIAAVQRGVAAAVAEAGDQEGVGDARTPGAAAGGTGSTESAAGGPARAATTAEPRIGLIGFDKDASSYYLREFPQWPLVQADQTDVTSATDLRRYLFESGGAADSGAMRLVQANVPPAVHDMIAAFARSSPVFPQLVNEYGFIERYRAAWAASPHPPTFVTADAVVVHSGHVLLVRRRAEPGRGLWALPGGFVGQQERILDACLRELREETRLKLPVPVLRGSLRGSHVFDHPDRSLRGRTITHAFHFDFPGGELPRVRGGDDADRATWIPVSQALEMGTQLFEDHLHILEYFLGRS